MVRGFGEPHRRDFSVGDAAGVTAAGRVVRASPSREIWENVTAACGNLAGASGQEGIFRWTQPGEGHVVDLFASNRAATSMSDHRKYAQNPQASAISRMRLDADAGDSRRENHELSKCSDSVRHAAEVHFR